MSRATVYVTHGPMVRMEGVLPDSACRMLADARAFGHAGSWWCKSKDWGRVERLLLAAGVRVLDAEKNSQRGQEAVLGARPDQGLVLSGPPPRRVEKTWLGRLERDVLTGITPFAAADVADALEADGTRLRLDPGARRLVEEAEDLVVDSMLARTMPGDRLPDVPLREGSLRVYQRRAVAFAEACGGRFYLADPCGAGKTVMATAVARHLGAKRILVVCPTVAKGNWRDEVGRFDGRAVRLLEGRGRSPVPKDAVWAIINPEILADRMRALRDWAPDYVVVDEAHRFRGVGAKRSRAVVDLTKAAKWTTWMSGTPQEGGTIDLWMPMDAIRPGWWGRWWEYGEAFAKAKRNPWSKAMEFKGVDRANLPVLRERLSCIMLRRPMEDILPELPERTRSVWRVPLLGQASKDYAEVQKEYVALLESTAGDAVGESRERALGAVRAQRHKMAMRLRRISAEARVQDTVDLVVGLVEEGERPVVFAHFRETVGLLEKALRGRRLRVGCIHGGTPQTRRHGIAKEFNEGRLDVLVGNLEAAGVAINLHHGSAVTVTHELSYRPIDLVQSEGRIFRRGQERPVRHVYMVGEGTVDGRILDVLMRKMATAGAVLDGKGSSTEDEVLAEIEAGFVTKG